MPKIKRALISVSDKAGVVEFAKDLSKLGVELLSTGGTAKAMRDAGLKVIDIADYTGSSEILDGRLKTLHPKVHGGLLGMRSNKKHLEEMKKNGIEPIDMVVVNLYPFQATIAKDGCTFEDAIENIDIGGPTMLRAAAKNWQDVAVVTNPADYKKVAAELKEKGEVSRETCFELAQKVFITTARYDAAICNYITGFDGLNGLNGSNRYFPKEFAMTWSHTQSLRYGENPHQKAAFYKCPHLPKEVPCISNCRQLQGKELSYNNIMDADAALELVKEFAGQTAAVVIKHTNPCGAAVSKGSISEAFIKARGCDPLSAFGGIVALTKPLDEATAKAIGETFFEVIIAPKFEDAALAVLKKKKNLRLLELESLANWKPMAGGKAAIPVNNVRKVGGGLLVQDYDTLVTNVRECRVATKRKPTDEEFAALDFAWKIAKHVKSNAIVLTTSDRILGVGAGQTSRIDSAKIARMKMDQFSKVDKRSTINDKRVLASDAFFPFRDGLDMAHEAGATAVIQPGGSIKDEEVVKAADEHGIAMVFTGNRHFRH